MAQADVDRRARVRQRNIDLNTQLAEVCAMYAQCRFDNNGVFKQQFVPSDVSTTDYFHPSLQGQTNLAAGTWKIFDMDADGWRTGAEALIGTDPLAKCATSPAHNAWPADINNDRFSDITDMSTLAASFGLAVPPAITSPRIRRTGSANHADARLWGPTLRHNGRQELPGVWVPKLRPSVET